MSVKYIYTDAIHSWEELFTSQEHSIISYYRHQALIVILQV